MKVAVTGATGFIGKYVLRELLKCNVDVVAVTRDNSRLATFQDSLDCVELNIESVTADVFNQIGRPDVLIHLAWDGLPNYGSLHHFETELPKHYHFLSTLIQGGLSSLSVSGTCFEYGNQCGPLSEDTRPLPANPYGFAKDSLRQQLQFL